MDFSNCPGKQRNEEVRVCIDMRRANMAILRENHPLPTMDVLLPQLMKAKLFSRLDLKNAFHLVEISQNTRHITTFISKKGLFRYKRLMFGMTCAPEIFQKVIEKILAGLRVFLTLLMTSFNLEKTKSNTKIGCNARSNG